MVKKWYEVDMNNSKNQSCYGKQKRKDLANLYKNCFQKMILLHNPIRVLYLPNQTIDIDWTKLNLSPHVTPNTIIVYLQLILKDTGGFPSMLMVRKDKTVIAGALPVTSPTPNANRYNYIFVEITKNKTLQYKLNVSSNAIGKIKLLGYIEEIK